MTRWLTAILLAGMLGPPAAARAAAYQPAPADVTEIQQLTDTYFRLLDARAYADAYALQTSEMQATVPFHEWFAQSQQSQQLLGELRERSQTKVTWYLDPPNSPGPGLYVAVDLQSRYANAARHVEYLIWFRKTASDQFKLARHETAFHLDRASDEDAASMRDAGARPVAKLIDQGPLEEAAANTIGFPTVAEARSAIAARKGAKVRYMQDGWLVIEDPTDEAVWSFTPEGHPAHPAAVKRHVYEENGTVMIGMNALCQADKRACDTLIRQFEALNEQAGRDARAGNRTNP